MALLLKFPAFLQGSGKSETLRAALVVGTAKAATSSWHEEASWTDKDPCSRVLRVISRIANTGFMSDLARAKIMSNCGLVPFYGSDPPEGSC